jgi:acyl-CoA reductase-like NAD-dependent aldehyde dehydrogenase
VRRARNYINGEWRDSPNIGESRSPSTGALLGSFADGGEHEADAAIDAAWRAFRETAWARDRLLRARALFELADRLEERAEQLALILAREEGKLLRDATLEAAVSPDTLRNAAGTVLTRPGGRAAEVAPGTYFHTLTEPIGVAGIIVPWNAPIALLVRSLGPALAAGCTVVVKMPAQTALTNGLVYEVVAATESLPAGVVNLFTESGNDGAAALVASPDVNVLSFTGSTQVGRVIAADAASTLKRINLELGGKTPMLVFDDADPDAVVPLLVASLTTMSGQFCMTGSRVLVQRSIADDVRERLRSALEQVSVGPSDDPSSDMGPLIDHASVTRIDRLVEEASAYATVLVRGGPITDGPLAAGAYFRPTLIEVDDVRTPIVQREIFGPVLTLEVFDTEQDAIERANATEYGLAAALFTRDADRARRVARELEAGTVWINTWAVVNDQFEEGGFKHSGIGRLRGARGIEEFEETKTYVQVVPADSDTT